MNSQHQHVPQLSPMHTTPKSVISMLTAPSESVGMQTLVTSSMLPTMEPTTCE